MSNKSLEKKESLTKKKTSFKPGFLYPLTVRTIVFLQLLLIVMSVFFISGNYQGFLDSTLNFIILLCTFICLALLIFILAGLIMSVIYSFIIKTKKYIIFSIILFFLMLINFIFLLLSRSIIFVSAGI